MPDPIDPIYNPEFLKAAASVMNALDVRYMEADLDAQLQLRDELDRAMRTYSKTRLAILKRQVICTPQDIEDMKQLQKKLTKATGWRQFMDVALGFAGFLTTRFL
jgi:hypothetical protein